MLEAEPKFTSSTSQADRHQEKSRHKSEFIFSISFCFCK